MCKKKSGYLLGGIILGAAMGAVAGVLFAPTSGKETRAKIKTIVDANSDLIEKTKEGIKTGFEKITKIVEKKRNNLEQDIQDCSDNSEAAA